MKHTKGPWPKHEDIYYDAACNIVLADHRDDWGLSRKQEEEIQANIRLMSRAPELLDHLIKLIGYQCHCDVDPCKEDGETPPETNEKNRFGEPVWANDVCEYYSAHRTVVEATEQQ